MAEPLRIVVVGGVAAGPKAAARARRLAPEAEITIVERDEVLSYAGCGLPYYISGMVENRNELMATPIGVLRDPEFFAKVKNVNVLNETEAVAIDPEAKELEVRHLPTGASRHLPYDRLIIATGAEPVDPPIPGNDLENVLQLKRVEDADHFRALMVSRSCPSVVIIGGGLIGMEMTEAVTERHCAVTIIEMLPQVLPMLDADMAALVEKHMREVGVGVLTATRVERIEGDENGKVRSVVTSDGEVPAQLVLMSVGIRPNVELARHAGLLIGPSGGIHVNEYMQTSDPSIYAAGDCAEKSCFARGTPCFLPLGSVANKEGRVAGSNAVGHAERFPGVAGTTALKVFDWNLGRAGLSVQQAGELGVPVISATVSAPDRAHYYPGAEPIVLKLVAERATRRLIGIQGAGTGDVIKRIDVAVTAMTAGMTVDQVANLDLAHDGRHDRRSGREPGPGVRASLLGGHGRPHPRRQHPAEQARRPAARGHLAGAARASERGGGPDATRRADARGAGGGHHRGQHHHPPGRTALASGRGATRQEGRHLLQDQPAGLGGLHDSGPPRL